MPGLYIQEKNSTCVPIRKASHAYGSEFLTEISPIDQPSPGAWEQIRRPEQYPPKIWSKYSFCNTSSVNPEFCKSLESVWSAINNPFTREDLLGKEEEQLPELILRFTAYLPVSYRERLENSLLTLFRDAKEEDPNSLGIAVGSLRFFYSFLQSNTKLTCPTISLTPEYNIYSTWRREKNRLFSVHFLPNGDAHFVIFKPNDKHPERKIRISGTATTDVLRETVAPYGVWDWISE
ncbi:MAG: hypothetical protein D4R88_01035 [Methanosarcinales archaeon]|nr:MAG: hypothetical protein D4R88_01035 [Methanosarcinales archaeon]